MDYTRSQPNPKKVTIVTSFITPKTMTNVMGFLGLTKYYKRFIAWYANIAKPFFALTKKDCKFVWTPIYQAAFVELKMKLVEVPILIRPNFSKAFTLDVDWSIWGVGAILS